jgi:hypothetical protein
MRARLVRTEAELARLRMLTRKEDARRKIQLGGLVVKAGLADESAGVLLGMLLDCGKLLAGERGDAFRAKWKARGDQAFEADAESDERSE